jgi:hypothetical protein
MKPHLRGFPSTFHHVIAHGADLNGIVVERQEGFGRMHQAGEHRSRGLRVVCETCNNGWMSRLQQRARPLLDALLAGRWLPLGLQEQRAIAAWATMFSMVYEFSQPHAVATAQHERDEFMRTVEPLENWRVWIRPFAGTEFAGGTCQRVFYVPQSTDGRPTPNVQLTTAAAGGLLLQTFSSSSATRMERTLSWAAATLGLQQVFPEAPPVEAKRASDRDVLHQIETLTLVVHCAEAQAWERESGSSPL